MSTQLLNRTGMQPLTFEGALIAETNGKNHGGKSHLRWYELAAWATDTGRFVASIAFRTDWRGELPHDTCYVADTLQELASCFTNHNPVRHEFGFPDTPNFIEKQQRLESALISQYRALVGDLLTAAEIPEKI